MILYGRNAVREALRGRRRVSRVWATPRAAGEDWLDPATEINVSLGVAPDLARAHARLGVAVTRGLLLDLLATREVAAVDAAMEAFIDVYTAWLARAAADARAAEQRHPKM